MVINKATVTLQEQAQHHHTGEWPICCLVFLLQHSHAAPNQKMLRCYRVQVKDSFAPFTPHTSDWDHVLKNKGMVSEPLVTSPTYQDCPAMVGWWERVRHWQVSVFHVAESRAPGWKACLFHIPLLSLGLPFAFQKCCGKRLCSQPLEDALAFCLDHTSPYLLKPLHLLH